MQTAGEAFWSSEDEWQRRLINKYFEFSDILAAAHADPTEDKLRVALSLAAAVVDAASPYMPSSNVENCDKMLQAALQLLRRRNYSQSVNMLLRVRRLVVSGLTQLKVIGKRKIEAPAIDEAAMEMLRKALEKMGGSLDTKESAVLSGEASEGDTAQH